METTGFGRAMMMTTQNVSELEMKQLVSHSRLDLLVVKQLASFLPNFKCIAEWKSLCGHRYACSSNIHSPRESD